MVLFNVILIQIKHLPFQNEFRGQICIVAGCKKRNKNKLVNGKTVVRSESEGSDDKESDIKRMFPRTFYS